MPTIAMRWSVCSAGRGCGFVVVFAGALGGQAVWAGEAAPVLSGRDVREENIVSKLIPPDIVFRDIKARPPSVSLLITFKTNSAELTASAVEQLAAVGAAFKNEKLIKYTFSVEGHADPRGNSAANLALSQRRAEGVRGYLLAAHGIEPQRLVAQGKGDQEILNRANPAAPENRRVTFVTRWQ